MLGRLESLATVMMMFGHFLLNIRTLQVNANKQNKPVSTNKTVTLDFQLATLFLQKTSNGISMTTLTLCKTKFTHIVDTCENGLGGWATHGRTWVWIIPVFLRGRSNINLLEFLSNLVAI